MIFLNGKKIAQRISRRLKKEIVGLKKKGFSPRLAIIFVGENPQSQIYLKEKIEKAKALEIKINLIRFKEDTPQDKIVEQIQKLNRDHKITGILVQLPLPKHLGTEEILREIMPEKDIDGMRWPKIKKFIPPTPRAILKLLDEYKISLADKKIVLLGRGRLVGAPLSLMLKERGQNPIICGSKTKNIEKIAFSADILVSATGVDNLVAKNWVKNGAVVIDCANDVQKEVKEMASYITPKVGGVGPLTVVFMFENLIRATRRCPNT